MKKMKMKLFHLFLKLFVDILKLFLKCLFTCLFKLLLLNYYLNYCLFICLFIYLNFIYLNAYLFAYFFARVEWIIIQIIVRKVYQILSPTGFILSLKIKLATGHLYFYRAKCLPRKRLHLHFKRTRLARNVEMSAY